MQAYKFLFVEMMQGNYMKAKMPCELLRKFALKATKAVVRANKKFIAFEFAIYLTGINSYRLLNCCRTKNDFRVRALYSRALTALT